MDTNLKWKDMDTTQKQLICETNKLFSLKLTSIELPLWKKKQYLHIFLTNGIIWVVMYSLIKKKPTKYFITKFTRYFVFYKNCTIPHNSRFSPKNLSPKFCTILLFTAPCSSVRRPVESLHVGTSAWHLYTKLYKTEWDTFWENNNNGPLHRPETWIHCLLRSLL